MKTAEKTLDTVIALAIEGMTEEELDQELIEAGIDPEKLVQEVTAIRRKYVKPKEQHDPTPASTNLGG